MMGMRVCVDVQVLVYVCVKWPQGFSEGYCQGNFHKSKNPQPKGKQALPQPLIFAFCAKDTQTQTCSTQANAFNKCIIINFIETFSTIHALQKLKTNALLVLFWQALDTEKQSGYL